MVGHGYGTPSGWELIAVIASQSDRVCRSILDRLDMVSVNCRILMLRCVC